MDRTAHVTVTAVAMGAGLILGAVGVYIYESLTQKKKNDQFQRSLSELKNEVKELRQLQHKRNVRRQRVSVEQSRSSVSTYDGDDDEFFDVEDELDSEDKIGFVDIQLKEYNGDKVKALHTLLELIEENDQDCQILWRLAMAYYQLSLRMEGDAKKEYINKGIECGKKALDADPKVMEAHKYYAICVGARSEWQGTSDKIKDGMEFQKHVLKAMEISPDDATLYHLLGRFQFEVSGLSWFQRKAAETLFGEVPSSTYDVALSSLAKAHKLSERPWKENMFYIAKCYAELGKMGEAIEWLLNAKDVPAESPQEKKVEEEIRTFLRHLDG